MPDSPKAISQKLSGVQEVKRLGKNIDSYAGETIEITSVLNDCVVAARSHGWSVGEIRANADLNLLALTRTAGPPSIQSLRPHRVYLSTGIHGDEPAGPLAVRQLLQENHWPKAVDLWLLPCLNPTGFMLNRRENARGVDLNREYLEPKVDETLAHVAWLERQPPFDLCLCLHEDWEAHGFYVYELNPDDQPSLAPGMVKAAAAVCPIDRSELIEGRIAKDGIIRPSVDPRSRPQWPESFYLLTRKTRLSYTLEAPSDFPLSTRVACLVAAVTAALNP